MAKNDPLMTNQLLTSSEELFSILGELDKNKATKEVHLGQLAAFSKLEKVSTVLNELASQIFEDRYDISGINMDNIDQVYNPLYSGICSMEKTRELLIKKGMS